MSNLSNYVSDKIRKIDSLSPVSKKRVQLKLMQSKSVSEEILKNFEEDIKEMEQLDEQYFRIPPNLCLTTPNKYTQKEFEETQKEVQKLELRYKQNQAFLQMLELEVVTMEKLQATIDQEKEIFTNIDELMKVLDISELEKLYNQVVDKK